MPNDPNRKVTTEFIDIYCLVDLTEEQKASWIFDFDNGEDGHYWVQPHFVPWTDASRDGNLDDLYQIHQSGGPDLGGESYFIDRECLCNNSVIVAQTDGEILLHSLGALEFFNSHIQEYPMEEIEQFHDGHLGAVYEHAADRGLVFGRIPSKQLRIVHANLSIGNMDLEELVSCCGEGKVGCGTIELIPNPDWNLEAFMRKIAQANGLTPKF